MIDLFKVRMAPEVPAALETVCQSGYIGQGPKVEEFEAQLRLFLRSPYVLTVNSCTSALHLALYLCRSECWPERPTVLVSPLTCTATIWPILHNGMEPRWVDIDPSTGNMDLADLERKLSYRTAAIMAVHWGGYPVDYDALKEIQDKAERNFGHRPVVIEDAAHALGSSVHGLPVGCYRMEGGTYNGERNDHITCFSFQAIKHLTTGDGGCMTFSSQEWYERAKLLRWFGLDRESGADMRCCQNVQEAGFKFHCNDIAAAIGLANMKELPEAVDKHRANGEYYSRELQGAQDIRILEAKPGYNSACWVYTLAVERRLAFAAKMKEKGIAVSQVHMRCDKHACVSRFKAPLPNMDGFDGEYIAIPSGWWVSEDDRKHVVETIRGGW